MDSKEILRKIHYYKGTHIRQEENDTRNLLTEAESAIEALESQLIIQTKRAEEWRTIAAEEQEMRITYEESGLTPDRAKELARAEKDGRLVVLPCAIGTLVYKLREIGCNCEPFCDTPCSGVNRACYSYNEDMEIYEEKFSWFHVPDVGKTVFATREEAEAALAE